MKPSFKSFNRHDIYVKMKPPFNGRCHKCNTWFVKL